MIYGGSSDGNDDVVVGGSMDSGEI